MALIKEDKYREDFTVEIVERNPDIYVYITEKKYEAKGKDGIWYFEKYNEDSKIKFVDNNADLEIEYVDKKHKAGWKNKKHRLRNRIAK